jgi:acetyl esterase/lipase
MTLSPIVKISSVSLALALTLTGCATTETPTPEPQQSPTSTDTQPAPTDEQTGNPDTPAEEEAGETREAPNTPKSKNLDADALDKIEDNSENLLPEADLRADIDVSDVEVRKNIIYTTAPTSNGNIDLALDMYVPLDEEGNPVLENRPGIVLVHGGSFLFGSKDLTTITNWATALAEAGYPTAAINYRLILSDPTLTTPDLIEYLVEAQPTSQLSEAVTEEVPADEALAALRIGLGAAMEDTNAAIDYLIEQGINPDRIAVGGDSAGAITSLHLGYLNNNLNLGWAQPAAVLNLYGSFTALPDNPETGIESSDPALWTIHGTRDSVVDFDSAEYLDGQLSAAGIEHRFYPVEGAGHGFDATGFLTDNVPGTNTRYLSDQIDFLDNQLLD